MKANTIYGKDLLTGQNPENSGAGETDERVDLPITGMTCAACANRIERQLKKQTGVEKASVNFATEKATVDYNPQKTDVAALVQTIKDAGYDSVGAATAEYSSDESLEAAHAAEYALI
jgi:P-type Cu+ transporter